ncbi:class I SAM-dependent methyltransferase [Rhodococcus opacus]|uniref:class I SAM-dependent methyltransferase n=1 Tax=Rhodococcus opacus TaxID=37919 RepID=UPI000EA83C31|nr:class I SAM-dependent methyltransferase [Rhodococcus opacus]QZS53511.1 methyltransferase domain-containing protein [Rhodococcus opacus]RKM73413.1 SAM-dependent methyltransferase [Rhodococcus opacus]
MTHEQAPDMTDFFSQEFWDERYRSTTAVWSGNPNPHLVEQVADVTPGSALDVGSGEGADAIWLAARGWNVTGVDVSTVALERAAERAAAASADIADRTTWEQADILSWEPQARRFDLVSAHFMHLPGPAREALHRRMAGAVRPGGRLLVVGHHPSDLETSGGRPNVPDMLFTPEQVAAVLDAAEWEILVSAAPSREARDPEGRPVTVHDTVLHAVRRA